MTLVTLPFRTELSAGQPEVISRVLADMDAILAVLNGDIRNDNVAAGAAIAVAKLGISGTPTGLKFLRDDASWQVPPGVAPITTYRKVTTKDVVNTTTKTDLLNSEITIGAGVMGANSLMVIDLGGDYLNSPAGNKTITLELALGGTVLWDGAASDPITNASPRRAWRLFAAIQAMNSTSAQQGHALFSMGSNNSATTGTGALNAPNPDLGGIPLQTIASVLNMSLAQALTFKVTHQTADPAISMRLTRGIIQVYA
jgi:hypothetical protein